MVQVATLASSRIGVDLVDTGAFQARFRGRDSQPGGIATLGRRGDQMVNTLNHKRRRRRCRGGWDTMS